VTDEELEILENHVDGALSAHDAARVSRRAALDPEWAAALERLRAERAMRQAVWQSLEPNAAAAQAAGRDALAAAVRAERSRRFARIARRASGVAAGLLIAFTGGWVARGRLASPAGPASPLAPTGFQVALTDSGGKIIAVQHFSDPGQARRFAEDVGRWQSSRRQEAKDDSSGDFSQVSDEF
jgi:hypothetical protein